MCTLTWWIGDEGYEVFFNRDEKKDRPVADPPVVGEKNGVAFLAPRDPAAGGTWLLANEFGVTLGLLNWYARELRSGDGDTPFVSRGRLLLDLADCRDSESVGKQLNAAGLRRYRPFRVVGFFPSNGGCEVVRWNSNGEGMPDRTESPEMPICSSSFERESVIDCRRTAWESAAIPGPEDHWRFHHGTDSKGEHSAFSVRMNRPDAQTWSISRVAVGADRIHFRYQAEKPDLGAPPDETRAEQVRRSEA